MPDDLYIEYMPLDDLVKMERNPKLHSPDIDKSFERYGYVEPVCIDEGSGKLVAGHGRLEKLVSRRDSGGEIPTRIKVEGGVWLIPVVRGVTFESEELAEEYNVTANALTIQGGFDEAELEALIDEIGIEPLGLEQLAEEIVGNLEEIEVDIEGYLEPPGDPDEDDEAESGTKLPRSSGGGTQDGSDSAEADEEDDRKLSDDQWYDQLPFELRGVAQLVEEAYFYNEDDDWLEPNEMGIPNLRPDMLVEELPEGLKVWGDRLSTRTMVPAPGSGTTAQRLHQCEMIVKVFSLT